MSKAALAALDKLMSRERDKELDDDREPKHAEVSIKGDPEAVDAATHSLGLPSPDDIHDTMHGHDHDAEDDHVPEEEHPVVAALRDEHPEIHEAMQRRGLC